MLLRQRCGERKNSVERGAWSEEGGEERGLADSPMVKATEQADGLLPQPQAKLRCTF